MADRQGALILALLLAVAALALVFSPGRDGKRDWHAGLRHPALWVLLSLAASFGISAAIGGRGIVGLLALPFMGAAVLPGARKPPPPTKPERPVPNGPPPKPPMTRKEAFEILGLTPNATLEEVESAYRHMMWFGDPEHGGSEWLVAHLKEARRTLIKR
jgi:hypothetical protein